MQPTQPTQLTPGVRARAIARMPMKTLGRIEDVAGIGHGLASAECSFCTGAVPGVPGSRATH
jgi:NAD(P)-dependent dehydrogenase (short-subunit alcohol dehydrogenase family)